jgi:hypothetical protein
MKLPKLSPEEILALRAPGDKASKELSDRFKVHLMVGLNRNTSVEVRVLSSPIRLEEGDLPRMYADDALLTAWVATRFGTTNVNQPIPAHHAASLQKKIIQALAELVLSNKLADRHSLCVEISLNGYAGKLDIDWHGMTDEALKKWAIKQWSGA